MQLFFGRRALPNELGDDGLGDTELPIYDGLHGLDARLHSHRQ
jgi:hypothetical protein